MILRAGEGGVAEVVKMDLKRVLDDGLPDLVLQPFDVVYVPKSKIAAVSPDAGTPLQRGLASALLVVLSIPLIFWGLGDYSLVNDDEEIYHVVARTMVETGDWTRLQFYDEHRVYDTGKAAFGRVKPTHNFNPSEDHWGAFELAGRYSYLDLDSSGVDGGKLGNATLGLNWYLNHYSRVMFNYVLTHPEGLDFGHIWQFRWQVNF